MPLSSHIKAEPRPPLTRERVMWARDMYAAGEEVRRILADCQLSLHQFYRCLDGRPFGRHGEAMSVIARRRVVIGRRHRALMADPRPLVRRLTRIAEGLLIETGNRMLAGDQSQTDRDRDLRIVMSLDEALRTLQTWRKAEDRKIEAGRRSTKDCQAAQSAGLKF